METIQRTTASHYAESKRPWNIHHSVGCLHQIPPLRVQETTWKRRQKAKPSKWTWAELTRTHRDWSCMHGACTGLHQFQCCAFIGFLSMWAIGSLTLGLFSFSWSDLSSMWLFLFVLIFYFVIFRKQKNKEWKTVSLVIRVKVNKRTVNDTFKKGYSV